MIEWFDLNARHEAATLWIGTFLIYAVAWSSDVRKSCFGLLKTLSHGSLLLWFMGLILVVASLATALVGAGRAIGFWEILPVVTVTLWTAGSGAKLLMNFDNFLKKDGEFRRVCSVLTPATIVAALANIGVLHFWWEVALFPLLALFTIIFVYYESRERERYMYNGARAVLILYTLAIVSLALVNIVDQPNTWKSLMQALVLPLCLTIGTLPYIRFLISVERWQFRFRCPSKAVNSTEYGDDWPLTVDSSKLCCKYMAVWVEVNRKMYGLNGTATSLLPNWGHTCFDLTEIWKDDPHIKGAKVSVHRLIQDGLALDRR